MKTIFASVVLWTVFLSATSASESEINDFLKTRPSFKQLSPEEIEAVPSQYKYDSYFVDSAYRSVRDHITITILVRKNSIIGYHIRITTTDRKSAPLNSNDFEEAIAKAYDLSKFEKAVNGSIGVNNMSTEHWIYVDKKRVAAARAEKIEDLIELLKP